MPCLAMHVEKLTSSRLPNRGGGSLLRVEAPFPDLGLTEMSLRSATMVRVGSVAPARRSGMARVVTSGHGRMFHG